VDEMAVSQSDTSAENMLLQTENNNLRLRIKALQNSIDCLSARNAQLSAEIDSRTLSNYQGDLF
jgi:kinesin family protein 4/21/27